MSKRASVLSLTKETRRDQRIAVQVQTPEPVKLTTREIQYKTVERAKDQARALAESTPPKLRFAYAQSFCAAVIGRYWSAVHGRRPALREAPCASKPQGSEAQAIVTAIADGAAQLSVEEAAYLIGSTYAAMLPPQFRSDHGVYYTPPMVVRRLLDAATDAGVNWTTCRVLDPACGGGAFLGPVAARMVEALKGCNRRVVVRNIAARLRGLEIDPFAAWMSQVFLEVTLNDLLGGGGDEIGSLITVGDSLAGDDNAEFDLVIGNPPYGRLKLTTQQREQYRRSLFGHANLYGVFLDFAVRKALPNGGLVAYVTPTSFLSGEYFKRLRGLLAAEAGPVSLDFVSERAGVFDDVLQETLLAVYRRGEKAQPCVNFVEVRATKVVVTSAGSVSLPKNAEEPWILPRALDSSDLAKRLRTLPARLADWGYGVSTGPLVWNRYKERLRERHERGTVPLIWAESVSADGTFSFRAARRNHAPYFAKEKGDEWLIVNRPCVLLQRTTAKEQPRRLIAAELPPEFLAEYGAVTIENHLNMIVPIVHTPVVDTLALAAFLNSVIADRAFRCINGSVAVSAFELESMPLPSATTMVELSRLLRTRHSRIEIEELCRQLYEKR